MSVISDIKLNWSTLEQAKRRKIILIVALTSLVALPLLFQILFSGSKSVSVENKAESVSGARNLADTPDVSWITGVGSSNAALERKQLRDDFSTQQSEHLAFRKEANTNFDKISTNIDKVVNQVDLLSLSIAKEAAERKATMGFLSQRLQDVSNGLGFDATETEGLGAGMVATDLADRRGLVTKSTAPTRVKVSPFDMASIGKYSNNNLARYVATSTAGDSAGSIGGGAADSTNVQTTSVQGTGSSVQNSSMNTNVMLTDSSSKPARNKFNGGEDYTAMIPIGSIVRARLVSGMDAMVASGAGDGNQPVIAKITEPMLLPNGRMVDLRGCVLMAGGYGNLSTERVYMNTTMLSCINGDDEILETAVSANALGSDGKLGVRGVMVTRDGALILRTMQAGLLQGVATAFSDARSNTAPTFSSEANQFQFPNTGYVAKSSLVEGVNKSLDQMVQRYNNILDQIFPVLQIDAGRMIEFQVLTSFKVGD